jgi:2-polyprenyl-3-methyl-5-hydroxy-6-metoxy-1,4-benzoquinol methylase
MKMENLERSAVVNSQPPIVHGGQEAYSMKAAEYFAGARRDYVTELPVNPQARILEIGCGEGGTGALALSEGKCGSYCGVELCHKAAEKAKQKLTEVVVGNIEELRLPWGPATFDAVILSEVLEHLVDPWAALRKIRPLLKPEALVFASSPNISHYSAIRMLLRGQWDLTDVGLMDRTHLRWFTPSTYRALFESCGYAVNSTREKEPFRRKARIASALTLGRFRHLFIGQIDLRAHCS